MALRIVQLGSQRLPREGLRIGAVRRPPRGVLKRHFASADWFDLWFPNIAPSLELMKFGRAVTTDAQWRRFERLYRAEMADPCPRHDLEFLALLSKSIDLSVGCYCQNEKRCHRSILKKLLGSRGASIKE